MDTITMTRTPKGTYRYRRPRETLTERVGRIVTRVSETELVAFAERWAGRAVASCALLGPRGRGLASAISLLAYRMDCQRQRVRFGERNADVHDDGGSCYCTGIGLPGDSLQSAVALLTSRELAARQGV